MPTDRFRASSVQVLFRFGLRAVLLTTFAGFSSQGFAKTLTVLLALSVVFCAMVATVRRERLLGPALTYRDEAATYALMAGLMTALPQLSGS